MPNFTVDDADPTFAYSGGWAVQSDSDPDRDEFFQSTYHVATEDGATMSFQFQGSAFTLYGSRGPGHAKYQVQFDNTVVTLDASGPEIEFRQELFSHVFSTDTSSVHLVKLIAVLSGDGVQGKWLDVDYISFTAGSASTSAVPTVTSLPPWRTASSSSSLTAPDAFGTPGSAAASASAAPSPSKVPTILAVVFGVLIAISLVVLAIWLVLRRIHDRRRARERAFRYGQSSVNPPGSTYYAASSAASGKSGGGGSGGGGGVMDTLMGALSPRSAGTPTPYSQVAGRDRSFSVSGASNGPVEMRSLSMSLDARTVTPTPTSAGFVGGGPGGGGSGGARAGTPTTGRTLMSASPIAWGTRQKHRGDADSMRTDFLQV